MKDFKCRNELCKRVVAQTDGTDLYFDGKKVPYQPIEIMFVCVHCKLPIQWVSIGRKRLVKPQVVV